MSKKNMLCFIVVVLQVFAGVVFAVETHSSIYPLYFDKVASSPDANIAAQEEMWSRLLKFKLFGESHLEFSDRNINVPDVMGWTGTSNGDFVWGFNGGSKVGGPIVVSGDMIFRLGPDSITTGPVVVSGSIRVENGLNFSGKPNFLNVVHCVDGLLDDAYSTFVYDAGIFGLDDCPVSVPAISSDLSVPALYDNGIVWQTAINVNGAVCTGTVDAADGYCIQYIDVPPGDSPYDLYIEALETANHAKIIFRMPENGRLIRVFLKDGFYIADGIKIATMQMSSDAVYSDGAWNGEGIRISNSDYTGNLIFYTSKDITFPVFSPYDSIQGTFITPGSISIGSHLTFSGQLIAGNLTIDSDFDGTSFRYVPYDPPFHYVPYDPDFVLTGSDGKKINVTEDQAYTLTKADFPVFDIDGYPWDGDFIVRIISSTHGTLEIDGSAVSLNQDIPLAALDGTLPYSLTYTPVADVYGDKKDSLEYKLKYGDVLSAAYKMYFNVAPVNDAPIIEKASFTIKENSAFGSLDGIATGSVLVSDVDDESFTYGFYDQFSDTYPAANYEKVTALLAIDAQTGVISVKEGVVLNYESADSVMTVPIIVTDKSASTGIDEDALSAVVNATIRILDVNESPTILAGQAFAIPENAVDGTTVLPVGWKTGDSKAVMAVDPDAVTSAFGILSYAIKEDSSPFEIDAVTGVLSLKTGAVLDYETENSYALTVVVTDGGELSDEAEIVINVMDVAEPPYFVSVVASIDEHSPYQTLVGSVVAKDPDCNNLDKCVLSYEIVQGGSYVGINSEGYITILKNVDINYEEMNSFDVTIRVTDADGLFSDTVVTVVVNDVNEAPVIDDCLCRIAESEEIGAVVCKLAAKDLDESPKFNELEYTMISKGDDFSVSSDGLLKLNRPLDYESEKVYTVIVRVSDGEFADTAVVTVGVLDVVERSAVDITKFIDDEFTYEKPGVIYTQSGIVRFCWREGRSDETNPIVWGEEICADTSLVPGRNILVRSYYDATTNYAAADSVTVFYNRDSIPIFNSTVQPTITIVSNGKEILEDSCAFVKTNFTEISITVKDPVKSEAKDKDSVFTVEVPVKLKTTYISSKDLDLLIYTKTGRVLLDKLPQRENLIRVENSDFTFSVSFVTKINNVPVVIRYDEDEDGEVLKKPVMNANGSKSSRPVIEILYVVPNVKENIKLSYFVDATTGEALYSDSQGRLMSGAAAANLEKSIGGRNTSGIVNVSYKQNLESGEPLDVAYIVDNDGNIIADEFDAECYKVSYTYTDAHNHSSTSSTLFVLDTRKPNVEIVFPKDGSVFTADSIGIVWTVDGKEQDSLTVEKLNPGMNVITRTVLDRSGEKYSVTISVVRRVENKEKKFSNYLVEKLLKKVKFKITLNGLEIDATAGSLVSVFDALGNLVLKQRMLEDVQTIALPKEQNYIVRVGKTSQLVRMR